MIFLSHSSRDNTHVAALGQALHVKNVDVWLDHEQIVLAESIPRAMSGGLDRADRFVVAWSAAAAESPHVANELDAFYIRHPEPGRMLFLRVDSTPLPSLYAARIYLASRTPEEDATTIAAWSRGEPSDQSPEEIVPTGEPTPEMLRLFPRGPMVHTRWIPRSLIKMYAMRYTKETESRTLIDRAVDIRLDADPTDTSVTTLHHGDLPLIEKAGANEYWAQAFNLACLHGPRMVAALVLAAPDDLFDAQARRHRAELLLKLRLIS